MTVQYGVATGIVHSLDDPANLGRIQLRLPWVHADFLSGWAPVAAPLAGPNRGLWFMPEVDDEVLVGFERGDFDHPFILGYLWNGADPVPDSDPSKRTLITPGGHSLRFEDAGGAQQVVLQTAGGHALALSDTADGTKIELRTSGGHQVLLDDAGSKVLVQSAAGQKLELDDGAGSVTLFGGGRSITLSSGQVAIA